MEHQSSHAAQRAQDEAQSDFQESEEDDDDGPDEIPPPPKGWSQHQRQSVSAEAMAVQKGLRAQLLMSFRARSVLGMTIKKFSEKDQSACLKKNSIFALHGRRRGFWRELKVQQILVHFFGPFLL